MATGIEINYNGVKGLTEALENDDKVCSVYGAKYVTKVFPALQNIKEGNAIFTFPKMPIKCPGAPQKIMYLAEEYFREVNIFEYKTKYRQMSFNNFSIISRLKLRMVNEIK
jgi:hypothetical protein